VIAGLVALLLPAVQVARESARRMSCLNNLRNVGCALHGHLLARRAFPVGCTEWRQPGKPGPERCLAWSSRILPWLEQADVNDRIDFDRPFDHAANAAAAAMPLAVFRCPSADRPDPLVAGLGRSDYGGVTGGQWINGRNLFDQAYAVNWPTWEDELRSRHPGGGQALFGDGAVRLVGEAVDVRVLAAACTRAGGETAAVPP